MEFASRGRLGAGALIATAWVSAACSTTPPYDGGVDDGNVRNFRDGTVTLPSFFDAAPTPADAAADQQSPPMDVTVPMMDAVAPTDVRPATDAADVTVDAPPVVTTTNVRFVHALPPGAMGAPPAVDFCVRRAGTMDYAGPLVREARGGGGPGITALQATRYFSVPSGTIDVLIVGGTAADCSTPLLPPQSGLNVGGANGHRTVVVSGIPLPGPDGGAQPFPFAARVIPDVAPNSLGATMTAIRVFNAIPSPRRLDVGIVVGTAGIPADMVPLFWAVGFGEVGRRPPMGDSGVSDYPNGYYPSTPIPAPGITVGLRDNCTAAPCGPMTAVPNVATMGGSITSAILAVELRGATPTPVAIFCADHAPPVGANSQCQVLPRM
jgi:hypothetical protein